VVGRLPVIGHGAEKGGFAASDAGVGMLAWFREGAG